MIKTNTWSCKVSELKKKKSFELLSQKIVQLIRDRKLLSSVKNIKFFDIPEFQNYYFYNFFLNNESRKSTSDRQND